MVLGTSKENEFSSSNERFSQEVGITDDSMVSDDTFDLKTDLVAEEIVRVVEMISEVSPLSNCENLSQEIGSADSFDNSAENALSKEIPSYTCDTNSTDSIKELVEDIISTTEAITEQAPCPVVDSEEISNEHVSSTTNKCLETSTSERSHLNLTQVMYAVKLLSGLKKNKNHCLMLNTIPLMRQLMNLLR